MMIVLTTLLGGLLANRGLVFLREWLVSAWSKLPKAEYVMIGEIGFYLRDTRSASAIVDHPAVVYRLSATALARVEVEVPAAALALHRFMAEFSSRCLLLNTRVMEAMVE
jgi:hypothetical protein